MRYTKYGKHILEGGSFMEKYYNKKSRWKHLFKNTSITILILTVFILLFNMYIKVDVNENNTIQTQKLSRNSRSS